MFEWNLKERFDALDYQVQRLRHDVHAVMMQNEAILSELQKRPSKLSPADQEKLNTIFATATGDIAKIDAAISPKT